MLYGRQEIRVLSRGRTASLQQIGDVIAFGVVRCFEQIRTFGSFRLHTPQSDASFEVVKLLGCYMVKPHGQLVLVSSTPHSAYTPNLSTS